MSGGSTIPDGTGRPGPCDNGILAAVLFALLSILLIATVPDDAPAPDPHGRLGRDDYGTSAFRSGSTHASLSTS